MLTLTKLVLTSQKLNKLNQAHRNWVLFLGHVANEMTCLAKLMLWTDPKLKDTTDPRLIGAAAQHMIVARLLLGKQFEAYNVLNKSYFGSPLQSVIEKKMNPLAIEGAERIRQEFKAPNSVYSIVRNRFAFHYSLNEFGGQFQTARKAEPLFMLLASNRNNLLYDASEVILNRAILACIDRDIRLATERLIDAVVNAAKWFGDFCNGFIEAALLRAWGEPDTWGMEEITVEAPIFDDVVVPWFTSMTDRKTD